MGRSKRAWMAEKIVVEAPIPRPIARIAMIVNPGVFTSIRQAYLRSRNIKVDRDLAWRAVESKAARCDWLSAYTCISVRNWFAVVRLPFDLRLLDRQRDEQCDPRVRQNGRRA